MFASTHPAAVKSMKPGIFFGDGSDRSGGDLTDSKFSTMALVLKSGFSGDIESALGPGKRKRRLGLYGFGVARYAGIHRLTLRRPQGNLET